MAVKILAISGSLGARSSNGRLLEVVADAAPDPLEVVAAPSVATLPHFRPDAGEADAAVTAFRHAVADADGVVIATPEYSHGIPGSLKNALDWLVGSGEFDGKPVAVLNAAPSTDRGHDARASLVRTLEAQNATVVASSTVELTADESVALGPEAQATLRVALDALATAT